MVSIAVGGQNRYEHIPITVLSSGFTGKTPIYLPPHPPTYLPTYLPTFLSTDGSAMPPSNYVAMGILEAEELHTKISGPDDADEIYGEGR